MTDEKPAPMSEADLQFIRSEKSILERVRDHGGLPNRERADWILRLLAEVERLQHELDLLRMDLRERQEQDAKRFQRDMRLGRMVPQYAAMREIVQAVAERNPATTEPSHGLHTVCYFCGGDSTWDDDRNAPAITHESDCVWVHARAILAQP